MSNQSYKQLLGKSNEQRQADDTNYVVEQKELQLSADISETKKALSAKRKERANFIGTHALDFKQLSIMDDEIAGLEAGVKRLEEYKKIFFPAESIKINMFWKHHCSNCQYITSFQLEHRYGDKWDIYIHKHDNLVEYVARHGNNPEDYIADDNLSNHDISHPLGYYLNLTLSDFTASIRLLSTEEGGRKTPVMTGYRPSIKFQFDNYLTTGYHIFKNKQTINPGEEAITDIKIISKDYFAGKLKEGMLFDMFEGNRKVGEGSITNIINKNLLDAR